MGTVIQEPGLNSVEERSGFRNVDHGVCTEMECLDGGRTEFCSIRTFVPVLYPSSERGR